MSKYHELDVRRSKPRRRDGRGIAAGRGKTAGRGTKGQKARSGARRRPGFEGGQNPLTQRLPKLRGFRSIRPKTEVVYTGQLNSFTGIVDNHKLAEAGLVSSAFCRVKLVFKGEITKQITVRLQAASHASQVAIQKAGGNFTAVGQVPRPSKKIAVDAT